MQNHCAVDNRYASDVTTAAGSPPTSCISPLIGVSAVCLPPYAYDFCFLERCSNAFSPPPFSTGPIRLSDSPSPPAMALLHRTLFICHHVDNGVLFPARGQTAGDWRIESCCLCVLLTVKRIASRGSHPVLRAGCNVLLLGEAMRCRVSASFMAACIV